MALLFGQRSLVYLVMPEPREHGQGRSGVAVIAPELRARVAQLLREFAPDALLTPDGLRALDEILRAGEPAPLTTAAEGDRAGGHGEVAARRVKRVSTRPIQHKECTMTSTAQPTQPTTSQDMVVGTFDTQGQAEQVVRRLIDAGVEPTHISILAQNLELREQVQGYITSGDVARGGAMTGAWMGGLFGLLAGTAAFLWVPVFGPLIILGPLATAAVGALEGGAVGGLLGAILGKQVEKDHVTKIQAALQGGKYVVVVHSTSPQELDLERRVMGEQGGQDISTFPARAA